MKKHLSVLTAAALTCSLLCSTALAAGTHTVESGETMYKIADKHGVELEELIAANPQVKNPDLIFPGDVLTLPGAEEGSCRGGPPPRKLPPRRLLLRKLPPRRPPPRRLPPRPLPPSPTLLKA